MSKWKIDPDHSVGAFSIRHLMVSSVRGQMNNISGTIHFNPSVPNSLSIEMEIDTTSVITGIAKRDEHLKSDDFFEVVRYPYIVFRSSGAEISGFNIFKVTGDLSIHGITTTISLEARVSGPVKSPFGETTIGLTGETVLNREDFGLNWNEPMENGGSMVGKDVSISIDIEADLINEE